jgi:hypothetical protein
LVTSPRTSIRSFRLSLESIPEADEEPPPVIRGPEPAQDPEVEHHHHDSGPGGDLASSACAPLVEGPLGPDVLARSRANSSAVDDPNDINEADSLPIANDVYDSNASHDLNDAIEPTSRDNDN